MAVDESKSMFQNMENVNVYASTVAEKSRDQQYKDNKYTLAKDRDHSLDLLKLLWKPKSDISTLQNSCKINVDLNNLANESSDKGSREDKVEDSEYWDIKNNLSTSTICTLEEYSNGKDNQFNIEDSSDIECDRIEVNNIDHQAHGKTPSIPVPETSIMTIKTEKECVMRQIKIESKILSTGKKLFSGKIGKLSQLATEAKETMEPPNKHDELKLNNKDCESEDNNFVSTNQNIENADESESKQEIVENNMNGVLSKDIELSLEKEDVEMRVGTDKELSLEKEDLEMRVSNNLRDDETHTLNAGGCVFDDHVSEKPRADDDPDVNSRQYLHDNPQPDVYSLYGTTKQGTKKEVNEMMQTLAESADFVIQDVASDGNCMYHSVIDQLRMHGELDLTANRLRTKAVEYLRENPHHEDGTHLREFLPSENWDDYLKRMAQDGEWGDQIMLRGISEVIGRTICIISAIGETHNQTTIQPSKTEADQSENIFLGHLDDYHYVSLRPKNWKDTWTVNAMNAIQQNNHKYAQTTGCTIQAQETMEGYLPEQDELIDNVSGLPYYHLSFIIRNALKAKSLQTNARERDYWLGQSFTYGEFKLTFVGSLMENFAVSLCNTSSTAMKSFKLKRNSFVEIPKTPNAYMVFDYSNKIVYDGSDVTQKTEYIALLNNVRPGYLNLQPVFPMNEVGFITWVNGHIPCLNASIIEKRGRKIWKEKTPISKCTSFDKNRTTYALSSDIWPESALKWLSRERPSGWPDPDLRQDVVNDGCLIVPISHPMSPNPACEWRFSFAESEKRLATAISKSQRYCFYIFKVLVDFYTENIGILSTYFLKTIFFRACEIIPRRQWEIRTEVCILYLIDRLLHCLNIRNMPHYIISTNNIIDHISETDIQLLVEKIEGIRHFPAMSVVLLAENHCLQSALLVDPVLEDIEHFTQHKSFYRSVSEVMIPLLFKGANDNLKHEMYEPATTAVKEAHAELKYSKTVISEDEYVMPLDVFVQRFNSGRPLQKKFWFCFFMDCYYGTTTTAGLTQCGEEFKTIKELVGNGEDGGKFDDVIVPMCILERTRFNSTSLRNILFMENLCAKLFNELKYCKAQLNEECVHYIRSFIKMLNHEIANQIIEPDNTTITKTEMKKHLKVGDISQNYQCHYVVTALNVLLLDNLIVLHDCYFYSNRVAMFQEYIEDLEIVCDKVASPEGYRSLAIIWRNLGNRYKASEAAKKEKAFM